MILRQDRQIALHVAVRKAGGRRIERARARRETDVEAGPSVALSATAALLRMAGPRPTSVANPIRNGDWT